MGAYGPVAFEVALTTFNIVWVTELAETETMLDTFNAWEALIGWVISDS